MAWLRRERPPAALTAGLDGDERILTWADTDEGFAVAATPRGLWWPVPDGHRLVGWEYVIKAVWREDVLTVVEGDVVDDTLLLDRPPVAVRLVTPRNLPDTVRRRVERNIVERELVSVAGGAVRFVARRRPGHDGVVWWAHLEPGTPDTAPTREAVAARLRLLRERDAARQADARQRG